MENQDPIKGLQDKYHSATGMKGGTTAEFKEMLMTSKVFRAKVREKLLPEFKEDQFDKWIKAKTGESVATRRELKKKRGIRHFLGAFRDFFFPRCPFCGY